MKKILAALAATVLSLPTALAQTLPPPTVAAKSWMLLDTTSNQVVAAQDPDLRIEPASLAKIMTAYVVFSALRDKKIRLDQIVNVSVQAWKVDPSSSKMFIEPNKPVSINDLLYGLMVVSGNDAAIALAEAVAGTEESFVALMNHEAARMGLHSTHFSNPHGLPSADTYSTAQDLAVLAAHVISDFPDFYKIDSTKSYTYNKITQPNRNRLLWLDPSVDGMKTGHTSSAGYSIIASAKRPNAGNDRRLLAVVIGTNSDQTRTQEAQKLLNWGFQNFDTIKLYTKNQTVEAPHVWKGSKNQIKIGFTRDIYVTVQKGVGEKIKPVLQRIDPLIAPIAQNSKVGTLQVTANGKTITELPVLALEEVSQASIFGRALDSIRLLFK